MTSHDVVITLDVMTLARRVKVCREFVVGLSARGLSELAGLSPTLVSYLERGERESVEARTLVALATVLGTSAEWLLTGLGDAPTERRVRAAVERARQAATAAEHG